MKKITSLPENWCIKADHLKPKIAKYFKPGINAYTGYYHSNGKNKAHHTFKINGYTEISYEDFEKFVLLNTYRLPEKWAIKSDRQKVVNWFNKQLGREYNTMDGYLHFPHYKDDHTFKIYFSDGKNPEPGYTEISLDTFERYVLGLQPIPAKKVSAHDDDFSQHQWKIKITDKNRNLFYDSNNKLIGDFYMYEQYCYQSKSPCIKYREITTEEFVRFVLKETRKIIGYKVPYDLFNGNIKKNEVYSISASIRKGAYLPSHLLIADYELPKEIVESWEPVYEPQETKLVLGSSKIEITIKKGQILADGNEIHIASLKQLLGPPTPTLLKLGKTEFYNVELIDATYKIGCSEFTSAELKQIVTEYNKYNA